MWQLTDTSPEAARVLAQILRDMPFDRKWRQMGEMYRTAKIFHSTGFLERNPWATPQEIHEDWLRTTLGDELYWRVKGTQKEAATEDLRVAQEVIAVLTDKGMQMEAATEDLRVAQEVIAVLTDLGIDYALGGSWASSVHGEQRFTHDADITAEPFSGWETTFCGRFGSDYYVSVLAVQEAVARRSSFNLIHLASGYKVDVFIRKDRPFEQSVMQRRRAQQLHGTPGPPIMLVTAEDIILLKLEWYRIGNEISDRQWNDVLGVLKVQAGRLDEAYLDHWAHELNVSDLLARAREEARRQTGSSS